MADLWGNIGNVVGTFGKGVGQILTGDWGGAWNTASGNPYSQPKKTGNTGGGGGGGNPGKSGTGSYDYSGELKKAMDALAAAQRAVIPKPEVVRVFRYDAAGGLKKAQQMAANAVNPVYQEAMNNFLNRQQVELSNKQAGIQLEREGLDTAFNRTLQDSSIARTRNTEDTNSNIAEVRAARSVAARENGLDFDSSLRALNEGLGAAGMADSGLGQQQSDDAQAKMLRMSNEEVRQSENKVAAAQTLLNRSFEDLALKDTRAGEDKTAGNKRLDIDINNFIDQQALEKKDFTFQQEKEKAQYLAQFTKNYQDQLVSQWIQSLYAQGATGKEIQLASSTYR